MTKLLALALALTLAAPAVALPAGQGASFEAMEPPADDAKCDTCDAIQLLGEGQYQRARHILEMRSAAGDMWAITPLGSIYQHGWGVPVDYDRAMRLYQRAAEAGDVVAFNQIGFMVMHGLGRAPDPKAAWCWFEQAAQAGYETSTLHLAELMAGGLQPVSCEAEGATLTGAAADRRQIPAAVAGTAVELWNGVREDMTPDEVAAVLPAPYAEAFPPTEQSGAHPNSDVLTAPAAMLGQPAIARVTFVGHLAKVVAVSIYPQNDSPAQNRSVARALADRFDATYGRALQRTDEGGGVSGAWRHGGLSVELSYAPLPDRPPVFYVVFTGKDAPDIPLAPAMVAHREAGQGG